MLPKLYAGFGAAVLGLYGVTGFFGWQPMSPGRETLPAEARSAPGGYRGFHFWHSGYRGGK